MKERGFLYLSGGGDEHKTAKIDSFFLEKLPSNNILFVPIGKTADRNGYKKSRLWLANKFNNLSGGFFNVLMTLDLREYANLDRFSAVYIAGGNTYKLLYLMEREGFLSILNNYVRNGGIVYGASAGAVLMGIDISTYIEDKYLSDNEKYNYNLTAGMALVGNFSILTHLQEDGYWRVGRYFERKDGPVIGIPSGTAVMVRGNNADVIGNDAIYIFIKGRPPREILPGRSFVL